jgi:hypothetical protein
MKLNASTNHGGLVRVSTLRAHLRKDNAPEPEKIKIERVVHKVAPENQKQHKYLR